MLSFRRPRSGFCLIRAVILGPKQAPFGYAFVQDHSEVTEEKKSHA